MESQVEYLKMKKIRRGEGEVRALEKRASVSDWEYYHY